MNSSFFFNNKIKYQHTVQYPLIHEIDTNEKNAVCLKVIKKLTDFDFSFNLYQIYSLIIIFTSL